MCKTGETFRQPNSNSYAGSPDKGYIQLDDSFFKDIKWFIKFLKSFNGIVYYRKTLATPITNLYLDACLTAMGGNCNQHVYVAPINRETNVSSIQLIVHLKM